MTAVANIVVLLVRVIVPVILVILSLLVCKLQDYHILARRIILGGTIQLVRFLLADFFGIFFTSFFTFRVTHTLRIDCAKSRSQFLSKLANKNHPKKIIYQPHFPLIKHRSSIYDRRPQCQHQRHRQLQRQRHWPLIREEARSEREIHGELFLGGRRRKYRAPQHL